MKIDKGTAHGHTANLLGIFIMVLTANTVFATSLSQDAAAGYPQSADILVTGSLQIASQGSAIITTYASDCATQKTTFNLGETVCAKAAGVSGLRFQWVDPDGFAVSMADIISNSQTASFVLPSTDQSNISGAFTASNLGRWRISAVTPVNSAQASAFFTARDPRNPRVDLSIVKSIAGTQVPLAGDRIGFTVTVVNNGPDDAVNVHFVDKVFTNAIFDSLRQTAGPSFTCSGADCSIAIFPNGAVAAFVVTFTAGGAGGLLTNTATVTSDTVELHPQDNESTAAPLIVGTSGTPPTCRLVVTAPPAVTLFTGPGATSCSVTVNNLDAALGTGSAADTCPLAGGVTRTGVPSGNVFPVGTTILNYSANDTDGNTATAIQTVTVADNTPPTVSCPASITLEPTCPAGAIATWTAPVGSDNCTVVTTAQTAGPASGSVFPTGTTTVVYGVTDAAGNKTSCSFTVTVLTVAAAVQNLKSRVNASSLNGPQKEGLLPKLDAALAAFNRGNLNGACGPLNAFINEVHSLIAAGDILPDQGRAWIDSAAHIQNTIGCTNNPCT